MTLRVRALNEEEREALGRMARSRTTLGAGLVRRAQIVLHALEGLKAPEISARMGLCGATVRHWLERFNARGLQGLEEDVRSGRPPTYSAEQRRAVINTALTRPADLGLPFASWTLDRHSVTDVGDCQEPDPLARVALHPCQGAKLRRAHHPDLHQCRG